MSPQSPFPGQGRPTCNAPSAVMFCTYCGKSFTRKEHLERHIPTHTHVKPHRCSLCQLGFARKDLLVRHHTTFHEPRDAMDPLSGGMASLAGRTPIACQNCANAKTGCDKRVPCSRCAEKNLNCAARFARRTSKATVRAQAAAAQQQANANTHNPHPLMHASPHPHLPPAPPLTINPSFMEMDSNCVKQSSTPDTSPLMHAGAMLSHLGTPRRTAQPQPNTQPHDVADFASPHGRVDGLDDFMRLHSGFVTPESSYQDLLVWPQYSMDLEMYSGGLPMTREDTAMPMFPELSDASAASEPMTASSSRGSVHTRGTSIMSTSDFDVQPKPPDVVMDMSTGSGDNETPETEMVVIAAENAWNLARCNPPMYSGTCPRTAIVHLECLEQKCKQEGTWDSITKYLEQIDWNASDLASVVPLTARTRDKMLAITQSFLHKALEIHRGGINGFNTGFPKSGYTSPGDFNFIVLPPSKILEYLLRSYVRSLSVYYPLVVAGCVDPNEMLQNNQASTLLVLLMIAQGAAAMPMAEARYLAAGLTETCRISLFDIVEKDVELSADPTALRCALLFIVLGAWSGDKWLMDIAMGQRGMYMSMLKHAGMLEPQLAMSPTLNGSTTVELQWRAWLHRESQSRLVYNWVMLDQELSLFHDTAPLLAITDMQCPLPGPEMLWMASDADSWFASAQSLHAITANLKPRLLSGLPSLTPSLCELFHDFLHDKLEQRPGGLSPQQMRLLLHPLQSLICHLGQLLSCFSDVLGTRPRSPTKSSTQARLEEIQALLQRWYELTNVYYKAHPTCPVTRCNLVMYHLISLNAVTNFREVERLSRREAFDGSYWEFSLRHQRCILNREEAVSHCGQVFSLLRLMPNDGRPNWWTAALYRATLVLWVDSIARSVPDAQNQSPPTRRGSVDPSSPPGCVSAPPTPAPVAIDQVAMEDKAAYDYLYCGGRVAVLTRADGSTIRLDNPSEVLGYAIKMIEGGLSSRLGDGMRRKLLALGSHWAREGVGNGGTPRGAT